MSEDNLWLVSNKERSDSPVILVFTLSFVSVPVSLRLHHCFLSVPSHNKNNNDNKNLQKHKRLCTELLFCRPAHVYGCRSWWAVCLRVWGDRPGQSWTDYSRSLIPLISLSGSKLTLIQTTCTYRCTFVSSRTVSGKSGSEHLAPQH